MDAVLWTGDIRICVVSSFTFSGKAVMFCLHEQLTDRYSLLMLSVGQVLTGQRFQLLRPVHYPVRVRDNHLYSVDQASRIISNHNLVHCVRLHEVVINVTMFSALVDFLVRFWLGVFCSLSNALPCQMSCWFGSYPVRPLQSRFFVDVVGFRMMIISCGGWMLTP